MNKNLIFHVGWAAVALGAFFAGSTNQRSGTDSGNSPTRTLSGPVTANPMPQSMEGEQWVLTSPDGSINSSALIRPLSLDDMTGCLEGARMSNDPLERNLLLSQVLSQMTRENAADLIAVLEGYSWPDPSVFESFYEQVMVAWGRLDGPSAIAYEENWRNPWPSVGLTEYAMRGWAESDPQAAVDYLNGLALTDPQYKKIFSKTMEGILVNDREMAFSLNADLEKGFMRKTGTSALGKALQFDQGALLAWAEDATVRQASDPGYADLVMFEVVSRSKDYAALAEWIDRYPNAPFTFHHTGYVVKKWAARDPLATIAWIDRSSDRRIQQHRRIAMSYLDSDTGP